MKNLAFLLLFLFGSTLLFSNQKPLKKGFHYEKDQNNRECLVVDKPIEVKHIKPFSMRDYLERHSLQSGIELGTASKTESILKPMSKNPVIYLDNGEDDRKVEYLGIIAAAALLLSFMLTSSASRNNSSSNSNSYSGLISLLSLGALILSIISVARKKSEYKFKGFGFVVLGFFVVSFLLLLIFFIFIIFLFGLK